MKDEKKCCKFEGAYSPSNFLDVVTGEYYILDETEIVSTIKAIERILDREIPGKHLRNFKLSDIEYIVNNGINVVLVEITGALSHEDEDFITVYRWFEVPDDFHDELYADTVSAELKALDIF